MKEARAAGSGVGVRSVKVRLRFEVPARGEHKIRVSCGSHRVLPPVADDSAPTLYAEAKGQDKCDDGQLSKGGG